VALARGFRMEADSLEALTPGQRVRQVTAIGEARGEAWDTARVAGPDPADPAAPDTVAGLALGERDLIFADTILGFFRDDEAVLARADTAAADTVAGDTVPVPPLAAAAGGEEAELERVLAMGSARSLYRMRPSREEQGDPEARRGINYVIGDTIELTFTAGEVDVAHVRGLKRGVYLDPVQTAAAEPAQEPAEDAPLPETPRPEETPPAPPIAPAEVG
jgi:hypothetical protein